MLRKLFLCTLFTFSVTAQADIFDRINQCEASSGGGGCIYDILRELAQKTDGGGHTTAVLEPGRYLRDPRTPCFCNFNDVMSPSGSALTLRYCRGDIEQFRCSSGSCTGSNGSSLVVLNEKEFAWTSSDGTTRCSFQK